MNLSPKRIAELGRVVTGKTPSTSRQEFFGGEYLFVTPSDLDYDHYYCRTTERTVTEEAKSALPNQFIPAEAVMFTCIGATIGKCGIAPAECLTNQQINSVVSNERTDPKFLYYILSSKVETVKGLGGGAATPIVSKSKFEEVQLLVPSLRDQQVIGGILSAYDDLIDNNRRRIKLLEDSVRLLFDEWFVNVSVSGWPTSTLQQLCVDQGGIQTGPFGSQLHQADYSEDGVPVVMPKDLATMKIDTQTIARIPEHLADELGRHRMQRDDIVFGRRGEIGRRAYIGQRQVGYFCGTGCLRLRPDPARVHPRFLFEVLRAPAVAGDIANRAKGSTMANLSAGALQGVTVPVPPRELQDRFATFAEDVGEQIDTLDEQSRKLRTARDLLLPRLMSGELTV